MSGDNYGRVTSGTAVALLGRVRVLYASPLFNRSNDLSRWTQAYNDIKDLLTCWRLPDMVWLMKVIPV